MRLTKVKRRQGITLKESRCIGSKGKISMTSHIFLRLGTVRAMVNISGSHDFFEYSSKTITIWKRIPYYCRWLPIHMPNCLVEPPMSFNNGCVCLSLRHYIEAIMTTMTSQITSLAVVYSIVYSGADQRKHQSSASLAFVRWIHRDRWIPRTKGQ